jgi:hypothetical protein
VFPAAWIILLFQMITRWGAMGVDHQYEALALLIMLGVLWARMAKEKGRELELFCICMTRVTGLGLMHRPM